MQFEKRYDVEDTNTAWVSGEISIVLLDFLLGQARVQVWHKRPEAVCPDIVHPNFCTYDYDEALRVIRDLTIVMSPLPDNDIDEARKALHDVAKRYGWDGVDARCRLTEKKA